MIDPIFEIYIPKNFGFLGRGFFMVEVFFRTGFPDNLTVKEMNVILIYVEEEFFFFF